MKHDMKIIEKGVVCRMQNRIFSYFAWPSVARTDDGALLMVCSGLRTAHVDPFGKVVMYKSLDEGKTWGGPHVLIDTALDDRDAGIVNMGGGRLVVTSFNNTRKDQIGWADSGWAYTKEIGDMCRAYINNITDEMEEMYLGSPLIISYDNGHTWSDIYKVPISAPHGPTLLKNGKLIYAGSRFAKGSVQCPKEGSPCAIYTSEDGINYDLLYDVPQCEDPRIDGLMYSEPHILELKNGRLVLHVRIEGKNSHFEDKLFSVLQAVSDDGGKTFSPLKLLDNKGAPPHLMQHSSGAVISSYGRRIPPYGISVMVSRDNCETWDMDQALWTEGPNGDLGYPCSVELPNGDIFTVFYAILPEDGHKCSILWTRWRLP